MSTIDILRQCAGLSIPFFTFCSELTESVGMMACGPTSVTSWGNPAEGMRDYFHFHCQDGSWDRIGCTVFMDGKGSRTLLDSEAPPWLVFGDWAISVNSYEVWAISVNSYEVWAISVNSYEVLRFAVFLNEKLDPWPFCLLAILDSAFQSFLAGVSHRDAGIGLGTFPIPWFAWTLSDNVLAVLSPLLDPSKTCPIPVCIPLCLSRLHGVGCRRHRRMLWPAPLSIGFALEWSLAWASWSQWVCPWWFPVWLALPRSALCPALANLSVPLLWGLVRSQ